MEKKGVLIIGLSILFLLSINLILAQYYAPEQFIEGFIERTKDAIESIFRPIIGGETGDEFLLPKIGFFFLTFILVITALRNTDIFGSNNAALYITSIIVSILSARFIPEVGIIRAMILPYISLFTAIVYLSVPILTVFFVHYRPLTRPLRWAIIGGLGIIYTIYWAGSLYIQGWDFSADVFAALPFLVLFLAFAFDGWIETRFENQRFSGVAQETRTRAVQDWMQQYRLAVENGDERRAREVRRILRRRFGINV